MSIKRPEPQLGPAMVMVWRNVNFSTDAPWLWLDGAGHIHHVGPMEPPLDRDLVLAASLVSKAEATTEPVMRERYQAMADEIGREVWTQLMSAMRKVRVPA